MGNWYAIIKGREDTDWGTGSFNFKEAVGLAKASDCNLIAEIDGGYNEDGNATADPICIAEYFRGEDF